jgi:hypothetical protein
MDPIYFSAPPPLQSVSDKTLLQARSPMTMIHPRRMIPVSLAHAVLSWFWSLHTLGVWRCYLSITGKPSAYRVWLHSNVISLGLARRSVHVGNRRTLRLRCHHHNYLLY